VVGIRRVISVAAAAVILSAVTVGPTFIGTAHAASGQSFTSLQNGFTQELYGLSNAFDGGVAFAPDGDPLVDECQGSGSRLHRYDSQVLLPSQNGTGTLHPETVFPSNAGCGLTNNPGGGIYSNTSGGVVKLDPNNGASVGGPFGGAGNALGITTDPTTSNLVYVGSNGTLLSVDPALTTAGTFSSALTSHFVDGIYFDPSGQFLFASDRTSDAVAVVARDGHLVQSIPINHEPDGIAFHTQDPKFVVTNNTDGTMTRLDFPANDYSQSATVSTFASGGFRGDLTQVGPDNCLYLTQAGTRFDDGTIASQNSLVRICPGFTPPPGVGEGHSLSFTPTSGKPGTLFRGTYTCNSGTAVMTVVNDDSAATATSDIDIHFPVTDNGTSYTQTVVIGREGNYTAAVTCGSVQLGTAPLHVVQALTYAGLGDSYSSGEGAPPANFIPPSDGTLNKCHRATTAWPMRIRTATNTTIDFAACSGAVIDDFQSFNVDNGKGFGTGNGGGFEVPQRDHISSKVTTLASLSVGGNDVGFPGVMVSCIVGDCAGRAAKSVNTALSYLTDGRQRGCVNLPGIRPDGQPDRSCYNHDVPSLHALYQDLAGRLAHGGRLVVTGYPLLFGDVFRSQKLGQPSCTINTLGTGITDIYRSDTQWLNTVGTRLNQTIQKEVLKAQAWAATNRPDVTIRFAPVSPAFDGHRLCDTKTPWISGLVFSGSITDLQFDGSIHPTPDGHAAIAAFIRPAFG
jgi:hypothetical protein